jgi:hypothetical protein
MSAPMHYYFRSFFDDFCEAYIIVLVEVSSYITIDF